MPGLAIGEGPMLVSIYSGMGRGEWNIHLRFLPRHTLSELVIQFLIIAAV